MTSGHSITVTTVGEDTIVRFSKQDGTATNLESTYGGTYTGTVGNTTSFVELTNGFRQNLVSKLMIVDNTSGATLFEYRA